MIKHALFALLPHRIGPLAIKADGSSTDFTQTFAPYSANVPVLKEGRGNMWATLKHPRHVEFYEEFHAGRQRVDADWMPMVRAVQLLQSHTVAERLYAFTSLWRFHLTTAPSYEECERHCSISIIWRWSDRRFDIAFGALANGWVDDRPPEQICDESAFPAIIEPFIRKLLESKPSD